MPLSGIKTTLADLGTLGTAVNEAIQSAKQAGPTLGRGIDEALAALRRTTGGDLPGRASRGLNKLAAASARACAGASPATGAGDATPVPSGLAALLELGRGIRQELRQHRAGLESAWRELRSEWRAQQRSADRGGKASPRSGWRGGLEERPVEVLRDLFSQFVDKIRDPVLKAKLERKKQDWFASPMPWAAQGMRSGQADVPPHSLLGLHEPPQELLAKIVGSGMKDIDAMIARLKLETDEVKYKDQCSAIRTAFSQLLARIEDVGDEAKREVQRCREKAGVAIDEYSELGTRLAEAQKEVADAVIHASEEVEGLLLRFNEPDHAAAEPPLRPERSAEQRQALKRMNLSEDASDLEILGLNKLVKKSARPFLAGSAKTDTDRYRVVSEALVKALKEVRIGRMPTRADLDTLGVTDAAIFEAAGRQLKRFSEGEGADPHAAELVEHAMGNVRGARTP